MNNPKEQWKTNFQTALSDYEKPGMDLPWAEVEAEVKRARRKRFAFYWLGAASIAAALAIFFVFVFNVPEPGQVEEEELLASNQNEEKEMESTLQIETIQTNETKEVVKEIEENSHLLTSSPVPSPKVSQQREEVQETTKEVIAQLLPPVSKESFPEESKEKKNEHNSYQVYPENPFEEIEEIHRKDFSGRISASIYAGNPWENSSTTQQGKLMLMGANTFHPEATDIKPQKSELLMNHEGAINSYEKYYQPIRYGLAVDIGLGKGFSLGTGLYTSILHSKSGLNFDQKKENEIKQTLWYLGMPLQLTYRFVQVGPFYAYSTLGGMAEIMVKGQQESRILQNGEIQRSKIEEHPWQFSAYANLGLAIKIIDQISFYAEPGLSYYFKNTSKLESFYTQNRWAFSLNLGFRFHFE